MPAHDKPAVKQQPLKGVNPRVLSKKPSPKTTSSSKSGNVPTKRARTKSASVRTIETPSSEENNSSRERASFNDEFRVDVLSGADTALELAVETSSGEENNSLRERTSFNDEFKVAVLGGGAGGVGTALELAKAGYHVDLYEKKSELLAATSNQTPGRAGQGYHYVDKETAKLYLKSTIEVAKHYPDCLLGVGDDPEASYLRHGLYCIMKQAEDLEEADKAHASIFSKERVLETYDAIKEYYRTLVAEDPSNKIFGEPDDFYRVLTPEEMQQYSETINLSLVDIVVDTREQLLNWPKLRQELISEVSKNPYITVHLNSTVDNPKIKDSGIGFTFTASGVPREANVLINATWENIEALNQKLDIVTPRGFYTYRLKIIVTMELPPDQQKHPSVFCAMGPHTMTSNMGNGTIMCTYSPVTNVSSWTTAEVPKEYRRFLENNVKLQEEMEKATEIREGASKYLPFILAALIIKTGYGIIKTIGGVDVFDPDSKVHTRRELGVEEKRIGVINNSCLKLLHFKMNGKEVLELVKKTESAQWRMKAWPHKILQEQYSFKETSTEETSAEETSKAPKIRLSLQFLLSSALSSSYHTVAAFEPGTQLLTQRGFFSTVSAKKNLMDAVKKKRPSSPKITS